MQDSLGGNAKTLMFVNISPADYNQEETSTALTYATRVKQITNEASKHQVSRSPACLSVWLLSCVRLSLEIALLPHHSTLPVPLVGSSQT